MRGSYHPCAKFPGLYARCAHYEGFPPSLCRVPGSLRPALPIMRGSRHPCAEFPGLYARFAHYEGLPPSLCQVPRSIRPLCP
ncbi:unnamed protein product, partial [Staurois parvus]